MPVTFAIALALAVAGPPSAAPESGGTSDSQIIVVEVPDAVGATPTAGPSDGPVVTPTPSISPHPSPSASTSTGDRGALPATGWDAAVLAAGAVLGSGALAAGTLISRARRRRS